MYHDAIWFLGRVPIQCIINQSRWMKGPRMMMDEGLETSILTLNKYFPLTVIQPLLLTIASELFSTRYSRLNHLFIAALKRFFSFAFHTEANMVYKYAHNFTNYFQKLTHIFLFVLSLVPRVDCLTFSIQGPNSFCNEIACCV